MSCQIRQVADINDVTAIRRHLFPTDDNRGGETWLQSSLISASPTGDILMLAREKRLVITNSKWDNQSALSQFILSDSSLHDFKDNVKAILCLPIVIQSNSSQVGPDWTCIAVAFDTGYISFFTENCTLLFEERLHNEQICALKCQSQHSPRPDICPDLKPEELYVIYETNVCVINGAHLFTLLRTCRSNLARGIPLDQNQSISSKKWGFVDQAVVSDVAVVGLSLQNTFDHLLTASLCGGFDSKYRAMPPHNSLVLGAGNKPFLGFHYALEGGAQPVLSDIAKAVTSKLKSALPGWLTGAKTTPEKSETLALVPAEAMACRFGLCDLRRSATRLVLSPDRRLAALSDGLGRVLLIDTHRGVAIRVFKGYREAQCAFIQVPDERKNRKSLKKAIALFLIIYSSKKGTLEIFCAQQGTKITTFTAAKSSMLVYTNYGLMGFQNTSKSRFLCQFTCLLMDSDGTIKEFVVPFHFSLAEKNSKRARDIHLYKRLKQFVNAADYDEEKLLNETLNTFKEFKTIEVTLQCLEMLATHRDATANVLIASSEFIFERYQAVDERDDKEKDDVRHLLRITENLALLSNFFNFISLAQIDDLDVQNGNAKEKPTTSNKSLLEVKEMSNLQRLLDLSTLNDYKMHPKVSFENNREVFLSQFLGVFDYTAAQTPLNIKPVDAASLFQVSEKIYSKYITENPNLELELHAKKSQIVPEDLFSLLLLYWVNRPIDSFLNLETEMRNFSETVLALTKIFDPNDVSVPYNCVSNFWTRVREDLEDSHKPFPALMAAVLCKSVAQRIEAEKDLQLSGNSVEDEGESVEMWEKLSQENCQWTLLIGKLEDVSLLNIILSNKPICDPVLPKLHLERHDVSLKYVLERGRGSVSEIVAQWLSEGGVNPEDILLDDLRTKAECSSPQTSQKPIEIPEIPEKQEPVFYHLGIIKKQFPYSLEPSVLLANMCWEYALTWQKDVANLTILEAALKCLTHIPNLHIKTGVYNLVWNTHLKIIFEASSKLINKVGKLPKERLCRQDTDLSDYQITLFNECCVGFFDGFMETLLESFNYQKPILRYEDVWENGSTAPPLAEVALNQNAINYDLVHLHYQLAMILHMMTVFAIKHTKVLNNLFDTPLNNLFFADLQHKNPINVHNRVDSKTTASRLQFLLKVISSSMDTVTMNDDDKVYSADHVSWMAKCLSLARVWDLDVDLLKRYQVVQILSGGFDCLALDLVPTITEKEKLGPELIKIAGRRLSHLFASSKDLGEKMSACSTRLTKYLDNLDGDWCTPSDLESTMLLITHALRCLDEEQPEYKIACFMLEACSTLQDLDL